jgi:hypothetical protein
MPLVFKKTELDLFLYWIRERHKIFLKRQDGKPKPWTKDEVLQSYFFTNPYRENDKVTQWFRNNIRDPLEGDHRVLFATVAFRWFNLPRTGEALLDYGTADYGLLERWDKRTTINLLKQLHKEGPVFTGAFMIKAGVGPGSKIPAVCDQVHNVWKDRNKLINLTEKAATLEEVWKKLKTYFGLGGFLSYEIVCDLRYTYLLNEATDVDTFCNPGPGAKRGMNRLIYGSDSNIKRRIPTQLWNDSTAMLLSLSRRKLKGLPWIEMREIEHSLCEFDKYRRAQTKSGKLKRKYSGAS